MNSAYIVSPTQKDYQGRKPISTKPVIMLVYTKNERKFYNDIVSK